MIINLISNWEGTAPCGVRQFGEQWARALEVAGHTVLRSQAAGFVSCDQTLWNWDSGTRSPYLSPTPPQTTVFVHHTYRGVPRLPPDGRLLSPINGYGTYFPYPIPTHRAPAGTVIQPKTLGVTTIRKEGLDYLGEACARRGWTLCPPDRWRETDAEIDRLAECAALGAWYTESGGRSLALATMIAAQRPLLLSNSQMFEYLEDEDPVYMVEYTNQHTDWIVNMLDQITQDALQPGGVAIPIGAAERWSWPVAIRQLEHLWAS